MNQTERKIRIAQYRYQQWEHEWRIMIFGRDIFSHICLWALVCAVEDYFTTNQSEEENGGTNP